MNRIELIKSNKGKFLTITKKNNFRIISGRIEGVDKEKAEILLRNLKTGDIKCVSEKDILNYSISKVRELSNLLGRNINSGEATNTPDTNDLSDNQKEFIKKFGKPINKEVIKHDTKL